MSTQQKILLATIAVLLPVWWLTLPNDEPATPALPLTGEMPGSSGPPPQNPEDLAEWLQNKDNVAKYFIDRVPPTMQYIDTSRPECVEIRDQLLNEASSGTSGKIYFIGDCDVRYNPDETTGTP